METVWYCFILSTVTSESRTLIMFSIWLFKGVCEFIHVHHWCIWLSATLPASSSDYFVANFAIPAYQVYICVGSARANKPWLNIGLLSFSALWILLQRLLDRRLMKASRQYQVVGWIDWDSSEPVGFAAKVAFMFVVACACFYERYYPWPGWKDPSFRQTDIRSSDWSKYTCVYL